MVRLSNSMRPEEHAMQFGKVAGKVAGKAAGMAVGTVGDLSGQVGFPEN